MTDSVQDGPTHELLEAGWTRLLIGAAIAGLSAQVMVNHAGIETVNGVLTLGSGLVLWAFGMTLTLRPVLDEYKRLSETLREVQS